MKKLILAAAFAAMSVFLAHGQAPAGMQKSPDQRAAHITKVLQKRLNLSADQAQQVNAVYLAQATRIDSLRSNPSADQRGNRLLAHTIMLTTKQRMMAILNDTQKQQFADWENMQKERHMAKRDTVAAKP